MSPHANDLRRVNEAIVTLLALREVALSWPSEAFMFGVMSPGEVSAAINGIVSLERGQARLADCILNGPGSDGRGQILTRIQAYCCRWAADAPIAGPVTAGSLREAIMTLQWAPGVLREIGY